FGRLAALEDRDVGAEVGELERTQAPRETPVDQLALGVGQRNAGVLAHQHANAVELRIREFEVGYEAVEEAGAGGAHRALRPPTQPPRPGRCTSSPARRCRAA